MYSKLIFFFLFFSLSIFSQKKQFDFFLKEAFNNSHNFHSDENFKKITFFFKEKKWDSVLIYTQKQASLYYTNQIKKDYFHLYRGVSFFEKKPF